MVSDMGPGSGEPVGQVLVVEEIFIRICLIILTCSDLGSTSKNDPYTGFGSLFDLLVELLEA